MNQSSHNEIALLTFTSLREAFPHLQAKLGLDSPNVDAYLEFPAQPGLLFDITLNLQGDELHLNAGQAFHVEWFPCTRPDQVHDYTEAVAGLLSGQFRIVEYLRGTRVVVAELQRPDSTGWRCAGRWSTLHIPFPWRRATRVLCNRPPSAHHV